MSSKWNYILCGLSGTAAIFCALIGNPVLLIINFLLAVFNWYVGENFRKLEDVLTIQSYLKQQKENDEKEDEENNDQN